MTKWIKFSDEKPPINEQVWISDGKKVMSWIFTTVSSLLPTDNYWMEVTIPDLPTKELHCCKNGEIACEEQVIYPSSGPKKSLVLIHILERAFTMTSVIPVKFCPFCGFTIPIA